MQATNTLPSLPTPPDITPRQKTLANGMRVISLEEHSSPNVSIQVWYNVGGKDDPTGRAGFAHLFEHLLFKKTRNLPDEAMDRFTEDVGGENNAYTTNDLTVYHEVVPSNHLERILWAEAERMVNLDVDDANFRSERDVVKEEYRQGVLAQPYGRFDDTFDKAAWTVHPYKFGVIGDIGNLNAGSLSDVIRFHKTYYRPDNATLIVVGDFNTATLDRIVASTFGLLGAPSNNIPRIPANEPPRRTQVRLNKTYANLPLPVVALSFQLPAVRDLDMAAAMVLDGILSGGESSRLYQELIYRLGYASDIASYLDAREHGSTLVIRGLAAENITPAKLEAGIIDVISSLKTTPVKPAELQRIKDRILTDMLRSRETTDGIAAAIGQAAVVLGDIKRVNTDRLAIQNVTQDDLLSFCNTYLTIDTALIGVGTSGPETKPAPIREPVANRGQAKPRTKRGVVQIPVPGKPSKLSIPSATKETLPNGLKLIIGRQRPTGITNINVVIGTGSLADKDGLSGTASLVSELLVRGTVSRDAPSIAAEAESLGGTLSTSITHEAIRIEISVPSTRAGLALVLLADLTQRSTFPEVELDKKRTELLDNLKVDLGRPGTLGRLAINRSIYGKQGYGRPVGGTLKSLTRIRQRDLRAFHATYFTGRNTTLVVTGDVPTSIKGDISAARWLDMADVNVPKSLPQTRTEKPAVILIDKRDAGQAAVMATSPGVARSDKRWPILMLANSILGSGYSARLNKEIRIQRGLAYGAFSALSERKGTGVITLSAQTRLDAASTVAEILVAQLERMKQQPVSPDELSIRRSALTGPLSRALATADGYAEALITQVMFGLPVDQTGIATTLETIRKAQSFDVQRVMQAVYGRGKTTVVVVGDARVCLSDLKKHFKTVKVVSERSFLQTMDTWS